MHSFAEMNLKPFLMDALNDLSFVNATDIQKEAIPFVLTNAQDLIALAQTGTGKTAAFCLPMIQKLEQKNTNIQSLILCPTRELALQIGKDLESFLKYNKKIRSVTVYGGAPITEQIKALKKGVQIVVGTPGRIRDLISRKKMDITDINTLILDEADEMLSMGFKDEIDEILGLTPQEKQTLLFSATMPTGIQSIAKDYMSNPHVIEIGARNEANTDVSHVYCITRASDRYEVLKRIIDISSGIYGIVFCRTRMETKEVAEKLMNEGYAADALHGDLSQAQRDYVMDKFRNKTLQLLIATDVAARGIDVDDLTHVLHYKIPEQLENYVHRSGRTGRAGKKGTSIALLTDREFYKIKQLEKNIGVEFKRRLIPTGEEVCERRLYQLINTIATTKVESDYYKYFQIVQEQLMGFSKEELVERFISLEFERFLNYYKNAPDLNQKNQKSAKTSVSKGKIQNFSRFYINIGNKHKMTAPKIIGMIKDSVRQKSLEIGKIEIMRGFSFFEIDAKYEDQLIKGYKKAINHPGLNIVIEKTDQKASEQRSSRSRSSKKFSKPFKAKKGRGSSKRRR